MLLVRIDWYSEQCKTVIAANNIWVHYLLRNQKNQREFTCVFALRFFLSGLPSCTPGPPNPSNPLSPPTKFQSVQYCISFLTDCILSLPLSVIATGICYKHWTCINSGALHCKFLRSEHLEVKVSIRCIQLSYSITTLMPNSCSLQLA